jgi:nucleotide-binding universal stress UspA family protein
MTDASEIRKVAFRYSQRWDQPVMIKDLMVCLDGTHGDEPRLVAVDNVSEHFDSHIVALFLNVLPLPVSVGGDRAAAAFAARLVDAAREYGDRMEVELAQRLARLQKPAELRRLDVFSDEAGNIAAREARTADAFVALLPNHKGAGLIEDVLLGAGRHLLLLPERAPATVAFDHAIVAWNGGREAARAVSEAIPYLTQAEMVSVLVIDEGQLVEDHATIGEDLIEHLLHHGVGASLHHVRKEDRVGATLIVEAQRRKADFIVMGGYGHSKLSEWLLGGTTYELMHESPLPILVAH